MLVAGARKVYKASGGLRPLVSIFRKVEVWLAFWAFGLMIPRKGRRLCGATEKIGGIR